MERLRKEGVALVYRCAKQRSEPGTDKRGAKVNELHLTPLERIDRIAALVPPPRRVSSSTRPPVSMRRPWRRLPLRKRILRALVARGLLESSDAKGANRHGAGRASAVLIARIYEVFPLMCPLCGGQMRVIAFITHSADIRQILAHIGAESEPPPIVPARGPPLWDE